MRPFFRFELPEGVRIFDVLLNFNLFQRSGGKKTSQKKASQKKISRKKASANKKASHKFYVKRPQYVKGLN